MVRLPGFFIVGAPKTGTTSLYHYLDQHPDVYMSAIKEPHYFADEVRSQNFEPRLRPRVMRESRQLREFFAGPMTTKRFGGIVEDWDDYARLFANASRQSALGEASVCYLWSPSAPRRIFEKIPSARIIAMLRDPADRAFAQYLHGRANGAVRWSFREHIQRNLRHRSTQLSAHFPFLEFGLYSEQIRRYKQLFGSNVWVGLHRDFAARPVQVFQSICAFLGVAPDFSADMARHHLEAHVPRWGPIGWLKESGIWKAASKVTPRWLRPLFRRALIQPPGRARMEPADRQYLVDFYRDDVQKLAGLLDTDLGCWMR